MLIRERSFQTVILLVGACLAVAGCGHFPRSSAKRKAAEAGGLETAQTAEIQLALGRSLEANGDLAKAMNAYREAARNAPRLAEPRLRMAVLLDRTGRFTEAADHYEEALRASPGDARIFCDRGYSLSLQGKDATAEMMLRQAIAIDPKLPRAHNNLAVVLGRKGRTEEALAEFRKAGNPETDARLNLAFALGQGRHWAEARKQVEIVKMNPSASQGINEEVARVESLIARAESSRFPGSIAITDPAVLATGGTAPKTNRAGVAPEAAAAGSVR